MKHKKLLLNSKVATLTQKNMPSYISRVITIILIKMSALKNYGLTSFQKPWLWCISFFFKVCPWIQLPFFMLSFFKYLLMFVEVKKNFPLNWLQVLVTHWILIKFCDTAKTYLLYCSSLCFSYRQNEGTPPVRPSSAGELPPLERAGSPTSAEKDILVCYPSYEWRSFREILLVMFYMKTKSWMLYFFRSSGTLYMYICNRSNLISC